MLGRAPAHSRRSIGGAWPYWPCWAPIVGWGAFGSPGPGPGPLLGVVDCRWSLRACRHGTLGRLHCGCRRSRLRALLCPFLGGGRGCPCGGSPGGPVPWGLWMFGARVFSVPASCLAGWGWLFPTHTIKHLHGGNLMNTSELTHTRVHSAFTLVYKTGAQDTHVLICCCYQTYFVILVMCAAQ